MNLSFHIQTLKKISIIAFLWMALAIPGYAQQEYSDYVANALLFSGANLSGTARYQGIGGAQTALGADMGSLSGNPAGLGMFKKSEFSLTSALGYAGTSTSYIDNTKSDGKLNFNIPNVGLVFSGAKSETAAGKWRGGAFGIGFTRQNSFQNQYSFDAVNNVSSILDAFTYDANRRGATVRTLQSEYDYDPNTDRGITSSAYDGGATSMYYNAYLVNPFFPSDEPKDTIGNHGGLNNTNYFQFEGPNFDNSGNLIPRSHARQQKTFETSGAQSQWNLSYGGNFDDRLYFGATVGIASLRYNFNNQLDETYFSDNSQYGKAYKGITLKQDLTVKGTGVNLNVGVILRVNDVLRLGASVLTPTFYNISETYNSSVDVNPYDIPDLDYNGYPKKNSTSPPPTIPFTVQTAPRTFDYKLVTPWRVSAGASLFLGKKGFLSADVEYVTYNNIKLNGGDASFKSDYENGNTALGIKGIKTQYQSVLNYKAGLEFRHNIFRFRGGFGYQTDPYQDRKTNNVDRTRITGSVGAGLRLPKFYFDVAATYSQYKSANTPYVLPDNTRYASALITNNLTNVVVTFGTFF